MTVICVCILVFVAITCLFVGPIHALRGTNNANIDTNELKKSNKYFERRTTRIENHPCMAIEDVPGYKVTDERTICKSNSECGGSNGCCRVFNWLFCDVNNTLPQLRCLCDDKNDSPPEVPSPIGGGTLVDVKISDLSIMDTTNVVYEVLFSNLWTRDRHPADFPSGDHWSPVIMASHNEMYQMWSPEIFATEGVQDVAETGSSFHLEREILGEGSNVLNMAEGRVSETRSFLIRLDDDHPLLSAISMIAPSPDWMAGVHDVRPLSESGYWWKNFTIDVFPYDAGTDGGNTYRASNDPLDVPVKIFRIDESNAQVTANGDQVFVKDGMVLPVGRITFILREEA